MGRKILPVLMVIFIGVSVPYVHAADKGKVSEVQKKIKTQKVVYLTFDDGPNIYTPQILDVLKDKKVKATFFMFEVNIKKNSKIVKRMVKEGHYPGLHSVSHDIKKLYKGNPANVANEMEQTRKT